MLDFPLHKKLHDFNRTLNGIYKTTPALFEIEDGWQGFEWISADENENNVLSFIRRDKKGNSIIAVVNFSGNDYKKYRLGVPSGEYSVIINSDDKKFGGNGALSKKTFKTAKKPAHGRENSILLTLPRFTGIYLEKTN